MKKLALLLLITVNLCSGADSTLTEDLEAAEALVALLGTSPEAQSEQGSESSVTDKKHRCQTCEKTFARKEYLAKHIKTHTGERPYQC
ncbi:MAG: hypothetical protein UU12_C0036G0010, partial [Candidatus Woesebacteria bacterium GW2011_GWA2_40_7b]